MRIVIDLGNELELGKSFYSKLDRKHIDHYTVSQYIDHANALIGFLYENFQPYNKQLLIRLKPILSNLLSKGQVANLPEYLL